MVYRIYVEKKPGLENEALDQIKKNERIQKAFCKRVRG